MGKVVKRIVLTGGPCAGKSSSLDLIQDYLVNKGYVVYTVQESATELINSGIKPFGSNKLDLLKFQDVILKYQLDNEYIYLTYDETLLNQSVDYKVIKNRIFAIDLNPNYIGWSVVDWKNSSKFEVVKSGVISIKELNDIDFKLKGNINRFNE